jgi:hypothetical protein
MISLPCFKDQSPARALSVAYTLRTRSSLARRCIMHKALIDATSSVVPETRGRYDQSLDSPMGTDDWEKKLQEMISGR